MTDVFQCVEVVLGECVQWEVIPSEPERELTKAQVYDVTYAVIGVIFIVFVFKMMRKAL